MYDLLTLDKLPLNMGMIDLPREVPRDQLALDMRNMGAATGWACLDPNVNFTSTAQPVPEDDVAPNPKLPLGNPTVHDAITELASFTNAFIAHPKPRFTIHLDTIEMNRRLSPDDRASPIAWARQLHQGIGQAIILAAKDHLLKSDATWAERGTFLGLTLLGATATEFPTTIPATVGVFGLAWALGILAKPIRQLVLEKPLGDTCHSIIPAAHRDRYVIVRRMVRKTALVQAVSADMQ